MDEVQYRIVNSDIQWYTQPALGYLVIFLTPVGSLYRARYTILEHRYGSPYSYPARDEAEARKLAVESAMTSIVDHWSRSEGVTFGVH